MALCIVCPNIIFIRFIAGVGLAGELGAGVTLTAEILPKEKRGLAATVIATTGVFGAVVAILLYKIFNNWRVLYFIGGGMGLVFLLLRVTVAESGMYKSVQSSGVQKGNFLMFFCISIIPEPVMWRPMRQVNLAFGYSVS